MRIDAAGLMQAEVRQRPTPNIGGPLVKPTLIIIHYTASASAASARSWMLAPSSKVSAHLLIDVDGTIDQLVPFTRMAWHAGESSWRNKPSCNRFSIGIELVNPGPVFIRNGDPYSDSGAIWDYGYVRAQHPNHAFTSTCWAKYPKRQVDTLGLALAAIQDHFSITDVTGHQYVTSRKADPGPAFPIDLIPLSKK